MAVSLLFVCTGNICRSPTAEAVMRHIVQQAGQGADIIVDSAGTHGYHTGDRPDRRAMEAAFARGYSMAGQQARPVEPADFDRFDLILAMDSGHRRHLERMKPGGSRARVAMFMDYDPAGPKGRDVPDPYYGTARGFEDVLDMIEAACGGLLKHVNSSQP